VGCCLVVSLLTFDIPQTALVATLDTYDFYFLGHATFFFSSQSLPSYSCCVHQIFGFWGQFLAAL
jgi:hypothetical protein